MKSSMSESPTLKIKVKSTHNFNPKTLFSALIFIAITHIIYICEPTVSNIIIDHNSQMNERKSLEHF